MLKYVCFKLTQLMDVPLAYKDIDTIFYTDRFLFFLHISSSSSSSGKFIPMVFFFCDKQVDTIFNNTDNNLRVSDSMAVVHTCRWQSRPERNGVRCARTTMKRRHRRRRRRRHHAQRMEEKRKRERKTFVAKENIYMFVQQRLCVGEDRYNKKNKIKTPASSSNPITNLVHTNGEGYLHVSYLLTHTHTHTSEIK